MREVSLLESTVTKTMKQLMNQFVTWLVNSFLRWRFSPRLLRLRLMDTIVPVSTRHPLFIILLYCAYLHFPLTFKFSRTSFFCERPIRGRVRVTLWNRGIYHCVRHVTSRHDWSGGGRDRRRVGRRQVGGREQDQSTRQVRISCGVITNRIEHAVLQRGVGQENRSIKLPRGLKADMDAFVVSPTH